MCYNVCMKEEDSDDFIEIPGHSGERYSEWRARVLEDQHKEELADRISNSIRGRVKTPPHAGGRADRKVGRENKSRIAGKAQGS